METKFNIGEIVWRTRAGSATREKCPTCKREVGLWQPRWETCRMRVYMLRATDRLVEYSEDSYFSDADWYQESDLFATQEAAQAECDKRNEVRK